jgi:hypothetical protein
LGRETLLVTSIVGVSHTASTIAIGIIIASLILWKFDVVVKKIKVLDLRMALPIVST